MKELFARYLGQKIGLNFKEAGKFHAITLVDVQDDYFSVQVSERRAIGHFPFRHVLWVMESSEGIAISGFGRLKSPKVPFVVQMYMMASGSAFGIMIPV